MHNKFSNSLIAWYQEYHRKLPWRETKDAYKIWLSEIILQQTRVQQGLSYYLKFIQVFPTVFDLANATEDEVLTQWQGLGYYSRARNLHLTAKKIAFEMGGKFPNSKSELIKLKGIGDYTSSAIASFCFDEPTAVIDGNVFRFIGRMLGIFSPIDLPETKARINVFLQEHFPKKNGNKFNQGLMEMGALLCTPKNPNCEECPFKMSCYAFQNNCQADIPVKGKKIKVRIRHFNYIFISQENNIALQKRKGQDIWKNLYEFPCIETDQEVSQTDLQNIINKKYKIKNPIISSIANYNHQLTHQKLKVTFWKLDNYIAEMPKNWIFASSNDINNFALPRVLSRFWEDFSNNGLQLQIV